MKSNKRIFYVLTMTLAFGAHAAVSPEEAKKLGGSTLTAMGAEKAGNAAGTIPEYSGQPLKVTGDPKDPTWRPDPFADEKPLFSITAQNADKYAEQLDGDLQLFKKYPNFRMDIYPSHRSVTLPKHILDNVLKNATQCKAVQEELVLEGCYAGIPFPIPKTGNQVMWNHLTAYEWFSSTFRTENYNIPIGGTPVLANGSVGVQSWPGNDPTRTTPMKGSDIVWRFRLDSVAPARAVGEKLVLMDYFDPIHYGRRAYQYIPGQRRVKLAPDLAYDTPSPTSGGSQTMDDQKIFIGALDRFDFKLVGKKEKFVQYNNFRSADYKACPTQKLLTNKGFLNPDCMRYELHRVWVVEATLKPKYRHIYKKRRFYYDEDGYGAGTVENYDASGALYRIISAVQFPLPEGGSSFSQYFGTDLQTGLLSGSGVTSFPGGGYTPIAPKPETYFSPETLAGEGVR